MDIFGQFISLYQGLKEIYTIRQMVEVKGVYIILNEIALKSL